MTQNARKIVIIGAGIAGLCTAVYARRCGYQVEEPRLPSDLARPVDNTHARAFQRHVNSGIIVHGRPSMMLGADLSDSVDTISSEGRPPNIRKAASARATP